MFFGFLLQDYSIASLHALHQRNIESGGQPARHTFHRIGQYKQAGSFLKYIYLNFEKKTAKGNVSVLNLNKYLPIPCKVWLVGNVTLCCQYGGGGGGVGEEIKILFLISWREGESQGHTAAL